MKTNIDLFLQIFWIYTEFLEKFWISVELKKTFKDVLSGLIEKMIGRWIVNSVGCCLLLVTLLHYLEKSNLLYAQLVFTLAIPKMTIDSDFISAEENSQNVNKENIILFKMSL